LKEIKGNDIYLLRVKYGVTIDELAIKMGVSAQTINRWELSLEDPTPQQQVALFNVFSQQGFTGKEDVSEPQSTEPKQKKKSPRRHSKGRFLNFISGYIGEGQAVLRFKDFFSDTFKKHKPGSFLSTKRIEDFDINNFEKPYMYFRVLIVLGLLFGLSFLTLKTNSTWSLFLITILGTIFLPLTFFVFMYEINVFRNIKLSTCIGILVLGGIGSIVLSWIFYGIINIDSPFAIIYYLGVGIIEETAKLLIALYFIRKRRITSILPAMLIGASVGVGFSIFESLMYAVNYFTESGVQAMLEVVVIRSILAIGGHETWAAISAGAFIKVAKKRGYRANVLFNGEFLKYYAVPVILHACWDTFSYYTVFAIIIVIGFTFLIAFLNAGLKEADDYSKAILYSEI